MFPSILFMVSVLTIISHVNCQDYVCPELPAVNKFDAKRLSIGVWYAYEIADEEKGNWKCVHYVFTDEIGTMENSTILKEYYVSEGVPMVINASISANTNPGEYLVQWDNFSPKKFNFLDTDYDTFATSYMCWPEHEDGGVTFIWTRERNPSEKAIRKAHKSIIKSGFTLSKPLLRLIDQANCSN